MKGIFKYVIILNVCLIETTLFARVNSDSIFSSQVNSNSRFISFDIAGYMFNSTHSGSWQPNESYRLGYIQKLDNSVDVRLFAEYYQFDYDNSNGMFYQDYSYGKRYDYAVYPAIGVFDIVEIGLGLYYTTQDKVIHRSSFGPQLSFDPAVKKVGILLQFGIGGSFQIIGPVGCSVGMMWRNTAFGGDNYFGLRAGMRVSI